MPSFWLPSSGRQSRATASSDGPLTITSDDGSKMAEEFASSHFGPFLFEFWPTNGGWPGSRVRYGPGKGQGRGDQKPELLPFVTRKQNLFPVYGTVF